MEKEMRIKVGKNTFLYGRLSGSLSRPIIIICHGLPGSMNDDLYRSAADWFLQKNYSVFLFNFYGPQKNARQLMRASLSSHVTDLDSAVTYFKQRTRKPVFVIGHSFGALAILKSSRQDFDSAVLWDPSFRLSFSGKTRGIPAGRLVKSLGAYLMPWGINLVIGRRLVRELDGIDWRKLGEGLKKPFAVIAAGRGVLKSSKTYVRNANIFSAYKEIPEADHDFSNDDDRGVLFKETLNWFIKL